MNKLTILSVFLVLALAFSVNAQLLRDLAVTNVQPANMQADHNTNLVVTFNVENNDDQATGLLEVVRSALVLDGNQAVTIPTETEAGKALLQATDENANAGPDFRAEQFDITVPLRQKAGVYRGIFVVRHSVDANGNGHTSAEQNIVLTVRAAPQASLSVNSLSAAVEDNEVLRFLAFTVQNTGNVDFANVNFKAVFGNSPENKIVKDNKEVRVVYDRNDFVLPIGVSQNEIVGVAAQRGFEMGVYTGKLVITIDGVVREIPFTVTVGDNLCDAGVIGNKLQATIESPDAGDDIKPGDKIKVEVNVDNNADDDVRAIVEAVLVNVENGKKLDATKSSAERVDESDSKDFTLELEVDPSDVDDGDQLMIFVKAYERGEELTQCVEDTVDLNVQKEDDDVRITEVRVLPNALQCGQSGEVAVDVRNFGGDDQDVRVKAVNRELGLEKESTQFELQEDEDADKATVRFRFDVPKGTEAGAYDIEARVLYSGKDESSFAPLTVTCTVPKAAEEEREEKTEIERVKDVGVAVPSGVKTIDTVTAQPNVVQQSIFDKFNSPNTTPVALWVLADLILVLIVVFIIYLVVRRR